MTDEQVAKTPRTHDPRWKDATRNERQAQRRAKLNAIAQAAGFGSWSSYETAVLNGMPVGNSKLGK